MDPLGAAYPKMHCDSAFSADESAVLCSCSAPGVTEDTLRPYIYFKTRSNVSSWTSLLSYHNSMTYSYSIMYCIMYFFRLFLQKKKNPFFICFSGHSNVTSYEADRKANRKANRFTQYLTSFPRKFDGGQPLTQERSTTDSRCEMSVVFVFLVFLPVVSGKCVLLSV